MKNLEEALSLLGNAKEDLKALKLIREPKISYAIFGFCAQQSAEKALKAWISAHGLKYPKTHDLAELFFILEKQGKGLGQFKSLIAFTPYAVQFRYYAYEKVPEIMDRGEAIKIIQELIDLVDSQIKES